VKPTHSVERIADAKGDTVDNSGNTASIVVTGINIDKTAPTTKDNAPTVWVNKDVTVTLTTSDSGGSGAAVTYYTVDGGARQEGTSLVS
jgi:hypothetical protein